MTNFNYWSRVSKTRLGRRRALAATGGGVLGAAFLAACGGGSDVDGGNGGEIEDNSGLLSQSVDESKNAKRGGVLVGSHPGVILTHDPMKTGINIRGARRGYSQLFRVKDGVLKNTDGTIEGDFAASWEISPDKLTITATIDPGVGTPAIPPLNGRVMNAEDVVFSWELLKKQAIYRAELANEVNPAAPIMSITAPNERTVVIKLKEPDATVLPLLSTDRLGYLWIIPREGGDQFDITKTAIGSGPFYISEASEIEYRWKRNPNFKRTNLKNGEPYVDEIFEPVIPEAAAAVAQFRTGAILWYGVPAADVLQTKKEIPALRMLATDPPITGTERIYFGQSAESPFKDERVRIAYMRTMDRDAFIAAAHNTDHFVKEGLPVETYWEASLGAGSYSGWYLDPRSKEFGPNAVNYVYDLAEAKKLIEAAGFKTPLEFDEVYAAPGPSSFPSSFYTRAEVFMGMVESSGIFKVNRVLINYQTEWNTERYRRSKGQFNGATWGPDTAPPDGASAIFMLYNSQGGYYQGGDATMEDLTLKARREFDEKKRRDLVLEAQRHNGAHFWNNKLGNAGGFSLTWPAMRNQGVFQGGTNWMDLRTFLDPEQPPLKKG
jgi:peptide/nickel transport system substrate-binding protein